MGCMALFQAGTIFVSWTGLNSSNLSMTFAGEVFQGKPGIASIGMPMELLSMFTCSPELCLPQFAGEKWSLAESDESACHEKEKKLYIRATL